MSSVKKRPWWDNLNRALFPYMGPAQLGPFDEAPLPSVSGKACPLCGRPMDRHVIERSASAATRLHCPI